MLRGAVEALEARTLLAAGPVAAYAFNEGAGTTVADASNTGNTGTITGGTWTTTGKFGNALSFNGTNSWVTVADSASLHLTNGMTLEAWVNPTSLTGWETAIMKERPAGLAYALYTSDNTSKPPAGYLNKGGADVSAVGTTNLSLNTWTHLALTYNGSTLRLYVNGTQVRSKNVSGNIVSSTGALRIGGNSSWGEYFAGQLDEIRIYNRALSQAEVQTDMNTPVGPAAPDTTFPTVAMTAPADGATVSGTSTTVSANASDNVGVVGVQFLLNGSALGSEDTTAPYSISWDTTGVANNTYTLTAQARDAAGNVATSAPVNVTVNNVIDTGAPTVAVTSPTDGSTVNGTIPVNANASDDVGVVGVQFKLDGNNLGAEDTTAPYSVNWATTGASNANHTLTAVARDAAGHSTLSVVVNVTVNNPDTTFPTVSLTAPANGATVSNSLTLSANASDNVGVVGVQFLLDGNAIGNEDTTSPYSITWDSTSASNGIHTLSARARDAAGNITTSATRSVTVANVVTDPAIVGQWSPVLDNWPLVDMHMALLDTGKVLMWDGGPDCLGAISATVWDPATNAFTPVPSETQPEVRDIFCSALTVLADGKVLVAGGHECVNSNFVGTAIGNLFDPATQTWTKLPDMNYRRWYPTAITLPDGRALVTAGADRTVTSYIPIPEIYDEKTNTWTKLTNANRTIPDYPFMFVLPDGRVIAAGSDEAKMATSVLDLTTQTWTTLDPTVLDAGSAVMYLPGKIMKAGSSYLSPPADNGGNIPSAATTYVLDMTQGTPAWQQTASMAYPRTHLNLTVLPDGNVIATGGSTVIGGIDPDTAVYAAEMWSPTTQTWTTMASEQISRMYHSTALLLPDGRVLVGGSGHNYANNYAEYNGEIYSPPYLFKGPRPTISSSPSGNIAYNSSFFVGTPDASDIASVSLIRSGAVTHSFNMDQRYVPLSFQQTAGGLTVQAPVDANTAPPGYYMLWIVNSKGVPSIAPFVHFDVPGADTQAPTAPAGVTANPSVSSVSLSWLASSDNVAVTQYNVYRSTVPGFTPSAANRIAQLTATSYTDTGLPAGAYYYLVTAQDAAGNVSPPSDQVSAGVTGDVTAPAVSLTNPTDGANVTGSINLTATASDDVAVASVQFFVDGVAFGAPDTAAPYSIAWNSAAVSNGNHTITARALDASGNATTSLAATINVANTVAPVGLLGAWGFDDAAGTTATDSSGHSFNGTLANATWTASGKFGGALSFNGANSWVTVADNALFHLTTGMTLEAWVKPSSLSGWTNVVMKERAGGLAYALYASDDSNHPPAGYINRGGSDISSVGASVLALGAWTHLATTYDGANLRLYVNGTLVRTKAITGNVTSSTSPIRIGGDSVWGEYFNGLIDEVRVYSRALSLTEIQTDMNAAVNPLPAGAEVAGASVFASPLLSSTVSTTSAKATSTPRLHAVLPPRPPALRSRAGNGRAPLFNATSTIQASAAISDGVLGLDKRSLREFLLG
ncbi:MAG TPA: Ig-like domain-containing protein [Tepidisphaeraceae bacterium]